MVRWTATPVSVTPPPTPDLTTSDRPPHGRGHAPRIIRVTARAPARATVRCVYAAQTQCAAPSLRAAGPTLYTEGCNCKTQPDLVARRHMWPTPRMLVTWSAVRHGPACLSRVRLLCRHVVEI